MPVIEIGWRVIMINGIGITERMMGRPMTRGFFWRRSNLLLRMMFILSNAPYVV